MGTLPYISAAILPVSTGAWLVKVRISSYGSKFFPLLKATVEDIGKMKIAELLPMKLYPFTLRQNLSVEKKDAFTEKEKKVAYLLTHWTRLSLSIDV